MTGLQWAVLTAYARTLPAGEARQGIEAATAKATPTAGAQRVAQTSGLVDGQHIAEFGRLAAQRCLPRLNLEAAKRST